MPVIRSVQNIDMIFWGSSKNHSQTVASTANNLQQQQQQQQDSKHAQ